MDARRARRERAEHDFWGRDREAGPVMFANSEKGETELVGEHPLFDHVSKDRSLWKRRIIIVHSDIAERIET
jgi:hypothetical protein